MRQFPSISDYNIAVLNKYYPDKDNKFTPLLTKNGAPYFEPGGRAVVYKAANSRQEIKAIKLFTSNRVDLFQKYNEISNYLKKTDSKYFVNFYFIQQLIFCPKINLDEDENYFPGLVMDWVEGKTLGSLIKELTSQKDFNALKILVEKFKHLSLFIIASSFGHGDLKHDNIIVDSNFNLKLIDYDDMFIPDFKGNKASEFGTPSFQHPKRQNIDFNSQIDDFSILTIYISLLTLAKYPHIYEKYEDQQNLLFRSEDFYDIDQSEIFQFIKQDSELKNWIYLLELSLKEDNIYIPELANCLNGLFPKPIINVTHSPDKVLEGSEIELFWETHNVVEAFINDNQIELNDFVIVKAKTDFLFKIKNPFETIEFKYKLELLPNVKFNEFRSKHQKIEFGKETQLVWDIENAQKVELHWLNNVEIVSIKGERNISPTEDCIYKLVATALDSIKKEEKEITVQVYEKVEIKQFVSDSKFIIESLPIKLKWEIENATSIILTSNLYPDIDVTDKTEIEITPKKDSNYTLKASNELFSTESEQITINVQNLPRFDPKSIPVLPKGNELIPKFDLDFKNVSENILSESQINFKDAMVPTNKFSLNNLFKKILNS